MSGFSRVPRATVVAALLILAGAILIATTWRRFSDTVDESTHVGAGMELLQFQRYNLQPENPPLPRVVFGAVALAGGMRVDSNASLYSVFYGRGEYRKNLIFARAGNLLFYALAAIAFFVWARREADERIALIAVLLFVTQPIVLGYAGIANHDLAATAAVAIALIAFSAWLRRPDVRNTVILGGAFGFSVLCKFSCIGYVPALCAAMYAVRLLRDRERRADVLPALTRVVLLVPPAACLVIWAGYGFSIGRLSDLSDFQRYFGIVDRLLLTHLPPSTPLPAPKFFRGIAGMIGFSQAPNQSYLFGEIRDYGFWWYFPAAVALKTTLAFFALLIAGTVVAWRNAERRWQILEGVAAAAAIMAVAMTSHLDLGVRYVLPAYIPLTFAAAAATAALLDSGRAALRHGAKIAIALQIAALAFAAPDYFPYFNELAGREPARCLLDSNLDWGQDVLRLRTELRKLHVHRPAVYLGYFDYKALSFPLETYTVFPGQHATGWIAVSEHAYRIDGNGRAWSWLDWYAMRRIGKSIRLYYVPPCD